MELQSWTMTLADAVGRVAHKIFGYLPNLLGSAALVAIGWLAARALQTLTRHLTAKTLERIGRTRAGQTGVEYSRSYRTVPAVAGRLVFWTALLFFAAAAVEALGLPAVSNILGLVTAYLPRLLAGVLIVFAGFWAGEFVRSFLVRTAAQSRLAQGELFGRAAQTLILLVTIIIAIDQIGIESTVLIMVLATIFGAVFGAAALAFGLGARTAIGNIIAAHYLRKHYRTGDRVRIAGAEGRIVEIAATAVVLDSAEGRMQIPASRFHEEVSVLVRE